MATRFPICRHALSVSLTWENHHRRYPEWARDGHQIAVQRLDPATYMQPDPHGPDAVTVTTRSQEAPAFFRRGGFWYLLHGDLCCFCGHGSDAKVLVSREGPLGPYHAAVSDTARGLESWNWAGQQRLRGNGRCLLRRGS